MISPPFTKQTCSNSICSTRELGRRHVPGMAVSFPTRLWIFTKGSGWYCPPLKIYYFTKFSLNRQMNMDFCLSEAMKCNMDGIKKVLLSYDLMCQFWTNLKRRFSGNPYLTFPKDIEILRAIGLFHVHGHQDHCYARFAPTFIPGAGMVDGEILETLWAALNKIADSTRSQSIAHRRETLNDHMNDSNWKKLVTLSKLNDPTQAAIFADGLPPVDRLCEKLPKARKSAENSEQAFHALNSTADPELVKVWDEQEAAAMMGRNDNPGSMDIYDIKVQKGVEQLNPLRWRLIES